MDPKATAKMLFTALAEGDVETAKEAAANLADWCCNGGFEVSYTIAAADMRAVCCTLATSLKESE